MGGGKKPKTPPPSPAETSSAEISKRLFSQTDPLRNEFLKMYGSVFGLEPVSRTQTGTTASGKPGLIEDVLRRKGGGSSAMGLPEYDWVKSGKMFDPASIPGYAELFRSSREGIGTQYDLARDAILAGTPRGGGQVQALANTEIARAKDVSGTQNELTAAIIEQLLSGGQSAAFGTPPQALSGLSSSGAMAAQRQQAALQAQAASNQGKKNTGMALGLGAAMTGGFGLMGGMGAGAGAGGTSLVGFTPSSGWAAPRVFF